MSETLSPDVVSREYGWQSTSAHCHHGYVMESVRKLLPSGRRLAILDAGCGNGYVAAQLASLGHDVVGIDMSRDGLELARRAFPGVTYAQGSVYDDLSAVCPRRDGWDVIVSTEVVEHLYSPGRFLRNASASLAAGGSIILSTPYHGYLKNLLLGLAGAWDRHHTVLVEGGHVKFFSESTLSTMLTESGFGQIVHRNAGRLPYLWKSIVCRATRRS